MHSNWSFKALYPNNNDVFLDVPEVVDFKIEYSNGPFAPECNGVLNISFYVPHSNARLMLMNCLSEIEQEKTISIRSVFSSDTNDYEYIFKKCFLKDVFLTSNFQDTLRLDDTYRVDLEWSFFENDVNDVNRNNRRSFNQQNFIRLNKIKQYKEIVTWQSHGF